MTLTAAMGRRPHTAPRMTKGLPAAAHHTQSRGPAGPIPMRNFEIAALRPDGSVHIGQHRAPAIDLFESAFSAFSRGTFLATPRGDRAVEDLQPGDLISTSTGDAVKLTWIGSSNFVPAEAGRRLALTRVMADSFGHGRPNGFITLGPAARILHRPQHLRGHVDEGGILTPLRDLVDGVNIISVVPPTAVRLFHICLERHATVVAGGLAVESFHPGANATDTVPQGLRDRFEQMFPQITALSGFGPMAHDRAPEEGTDLDIAQTG